MADLLTECIQTLDGYVTALSEAESLAISDQFTDTFPIVSWGRVWWDKIMRKVELSRDDARHGVSAHLSIEELERPVYVIWDDAGLPVLRVTKLLAVLDHIDAVTAVSFDTWLFRPENPFVIEFYHEGEVLMGWR
jgi:hypothetical protein